MFGVQIGIGRFFREYVISCEKIKHAIGCWSFWRWTCTWSPTEIHRGSEQEEQELDEFDTEFEDVPTEDHSSNLEPASPSTELSTNVEPKDPETQEISASDSNEETPQETTATEPENRLSSDSSLSQTHRERRFLLHHNIHGGTGGIHLNSADTGPIGTLRVSLISDFFLASDFLRPSDSNDYLGAHLGLSWTPFSFLELFASVTSYANSNSLSDPQLFQVLGDTTLGVKALYALKPWLTIGADATLMLLNTVGDVGLVFESTSVGLRGNLTADFRELSQSSFPLRLHLNLQYLFNNASKLIEDVENQRYANLENPVSPMRNETRHLVTRTERFSLNINRTDFFRVGLGAEVPLQMTENFHLHPILEWTLGIPVNRQGYSCLVPDAEDPTDDQCLDQVGFSAFPMDLTIGARILPPVQGLAITLAADIGLTGTKDFVRELAGNRPYAIIVGASYAYDTDPPMPDPIVHRIERDVEVRVPPPLTGRIRGRIVERGLNQGVSGAFIHFENPSLSTQITDASGIFESYALPPGEVSLQVTHPDYESGTCETIIPDQRPENGDLLVDLRCELVAKPKIGTIRGRVTSGGAAVLAKIDLRGPTSRSINVDAAGNFSLSNLPPGRYQMRIESDEHLFAERTVQIEARQATEVSVALVPRPAQGRIVVRTSTIGILGRIRFDAEEQIDPVSEPLLAELVDTLVRNPDIQSIEIQSHTHDRTRNAEEVTERRADAVRRWLIDQGIAPIRVQARGFGSSRPVVPNLTSATRARNDRISIAIRERQ